MNLSIISDNVTKEVNKTQKQDLRRDTNDKMTFNDKTMWEDPILFDEYSLSDFPVESFPLWIKDYFVAIAEDTQTPIDLASTIGLSALACTLAGKFKVEGKRGWREPLNLYSIAIMRPAERKSAVFSHITRPLEEFEADTNESIKSEISKNVTERKILEDTLRNLQTVAAKSRTKHDKDIALAKAEELAQFKEMKPIRILADDVSPEKVTSLLGEYGGRIAIMSPEGGLFETLAGRYSNGSCNIDTFLKGHSGDMLRVDRIGRPSEHISEPALTIGLAIQPDVLNGVMQNKNFRGRGLTARFLFSLPKSKVGSRNIESAPIPENLKQVYYSNIKKMLGMKPNTEPHIIKLSSGALRLSNEVARTLEPRLIDDLESIGDWAGKLHGEILRISTILNLAENINDDNPWFKEVSEENFKKAISIGEYFIEHARAAFGIMGADTSTDEAKTLLKWVKKQSINGFTKRDAHRANQAKFKTADAVEPALNLLVERNFILEIPLQYEGIGRKPNSRYMVNPKYLCSSK